MKLNNGVVAGIAAFCFWGVLPIYWKWLDHIPALEILCHRMVWSLVFLAAILHWQRRWTWTKAACRSPRVILVSAVSGFLLSLNWFIYIWAVVNGHILESSLGYFINPLVNVVLGVIILKERPRPTQWVAVMCAFMGVGYLTLGYGQFPWVSLVLAISFGLYGLMRKTASLSSLQGLFLEASFMFVPAGLYLFLRELSNQGAFGHVTLIQNFLLIMAGVVTSVPLLLFTYAARRIQLITVGLLQYISPSLGVVIGVWLYHEPLGPDRLIGFSCIWLALIIYSVDSIRQLQRSC